MTIKEQLRPQASPLVMDLVKSAGVDVSQWSRSRKGKVKNPSSNPAYCYDWAFIQGKEVVVLNLWHDELVEEGGQLWSEPNPREWLEKQLQRTDLKAGQKSLQSRRATRMDSAIAFAFEHKVSLRVIIGEGSKNYLSHEDATVASRMQRRLLDDEFWMVAKYNSSSGACRLIRGRVPRFIDQFSALESLPPKQHEVTGKEWNRDPRVRASVLQRAQGICECCQKSGFVTASGSIYLETHHVIPLSENGADNERNVVAICPNDHKEAHFGKEREAIRVHLLSILNRMYQD